ncbi:hypothetical protein BRC90_02195 [Halobacteriales archaeon QS_4_69_34]|nr:MAG: hypothetical protein BRC90_02195 [Halobacteriales archaeon QS_4_69_34]
MSSGEQALPVLGEPRRSKSLRDFRADQRSSVSDDDARTAGDAEDPASRGQHGPEVPRPWSGQRPRAEVETVGAFLIVSVIELAESLD